MRSSRHRSLVASLVDDGRAGFLLFRAAAAMIDGSSKASNDYVDVGIVGENMWWRHTTLDLASR